MNMESKDSRKHRQARRRRETKEKEKKEMVEKMMEDFKEQWEPAVDKLKKPRKRLKV